MVLRGLLVALVAITISCTANIMTVNVRENKWIIQKVIHPNVVSPIVLSPTPFPTPSPIDPSPQIVDDVLMVVPTPPSNDRDAFSGNTTIIDGDILPPPTPAPPMDDYAWPAKETIAGILL